jgi:hypothetical protein
MKHGLFLFPFLLLLAAAACAPGRTTIQNPVNKFTYTYDTIYRTYRGDFTQQSVGGIDLHWKDSTTYVVYNFCGANQLKIIDFQSDSVLELPLYNPGFQEIHSELKAKDLVVLTLDGKVWRYCNGTTEVEEICNVFADSGFKKSGLKPWESKPGGDQHIRVPENTLYCNLMLDFDNHKGRYSKKAWGFPIFAKIDLENGTVRLFGSAARQSMSDTYGLHDNQYSLFIGDSIIISDAWNGTIHVINTLDNSTKTIPAKSIFDTVPIQKLIYKGASDKKSIKFKHGLLSPYYESLFYNPYNGNYYRIFHPKMEEFNAQGLNNTEYDKEAVLMVFDKDLKLLDEVLLPVKTYRVLKLFPIKDGVAIALPDSFRYNGYKGTESFTRVYLNIHHR